MSNESEEAKAALDALASAMRQFLEEDSDRRAIAVETIRKLLPWQPHPDGGFFCP